MKNNATPPTRIFGGKVKNFDSKEERAKEQKHLKAFLRGEKRYIWNNKWENVIIFEHR